MCVHLHLFVVFKTLYKTEVYAECGILSWTDFIVMKCFNPWLFERNEKVKYSELNCTIISLSLLSS